MFKKNSHPMFIEEETYNWGSPRSVRSRQLVYLAVLFMLAGLLFSVMR